MSAWAPGLSLELEVRWEGAPVTAQRVDVGEHYNPAGDLAPEAIVHGSIRIPYPRLWSPEPPNLYELVVRLRREAEVLDEARTYFGMRKVHVEGNRFYLNNRPYYLRTVVDQGFWPQGVYTPPSVDSICQDVEWTRAGAWIS